MTMPRRLGILAVLLVALALHGAAQQQPATPPAPSAEQDPTFRAGINYVAVDVIVTDKKDAPVLDLRQEDFEVTEDGRPQPIEQFRLIKIDNSPRPDDPAPRRIRSRDDEQLEAGREDVRIMAILLDDYHTRKGTALVVKEPLTRFLESQLGPNDLVAVISPLTPVSDGRLVQA